MPDFDLQPVQRFFLDPKAARCFDSGCRLRRFCSGLRDRNLLSRSDLLRGEGSRQKVLEVPADAVEKLPAR